MRDARRKATKEAPSMLARLCLVLSVAVLAAACGGDDDDPPEVPAADTSAAATATFARDTEPAPVPAGAFASTTFTPRVRVTLTGDDWRLGADSARELVLEHEAADVAQQGYVGVFRVQNVRNVENFSVRDPAPADLIAWFRQNRHIQVLGEPAPVTIGGVQGRRIEVSVDTSNEIPLFDDFVASFRDRFRVIELTVGSGRLLIVGGPYRWSNHAGFEPVLDAALATMTFE
jgi:hypothetical protein